MNLYLYFGLEAGKPPCWARIWPLLLSLHRVTTMQLYLYLYFEIYLNKKSNCICIFKSHCKTSTGISTAHPVRQTECSIAQYLILCSFAFGYEMIVKLISTQLTYYIFKTFPQKTRTWYILLQTVCWIIQRYVSRNTLDARNICTKCTVRQVYNKCAL